MHVHAFVCVYERERETDRESEREGGRSTDRDGTFPVTSLKNMYGPIRLPEVTFGV